LSHSDAVELIETWTRFAVQPMRLEVLTDALRIRERRRRLAASASSILSYGLSRRSKARLLCSAIPGPLQLPAWPGIDIAVNYVNYL
jgi:hypothetical protein